MRRASMSVTTAADGSVTYYSPRISGKIHQIDYVKDGTNPFADGVDFTITAERSGQQLWVESNVNASATRATRQPAYSQTGAALLYAAGGTAVTDKIGIANDRVKIVLAQGGNAKVGAFHVLYE